MERSAKLTVEIPEDRDRFLGEQRMKRDPASGKKIRNWQIITAALDLLERTQKEKPEYDYMAELRKRDELPLEK